MNTAMTYFNIAQAAAYLRYSEQSVYDYTYRRMIPFLKAGKRNLFRISELDMWLNMGADYVAASQIITNRQYREACANINMNVVETAQYLHLEPTTIYQLKFEDRIPYIKMRKNLLFRSIEIDKWLDYGGTYEIAIMIMADRQAIAS